MQETTEQRRWLITGARGQLGSELSRILGSRAEGVGHSVLDITDGRAVSDFLHKKRPVVVVNAAAWTNVDAAEKPENQRQCHRVNAEAVAVLATACADVGALLVQISTDYVFGGDEQRQHPYREDDVCAPVNVYGESKRAGEEAAASLPRHLIVRTSGLYSVGKEGPVRGRNFADTMQILGDAGKSLRVVADQWCTPSFVPDVAAAVVRLVEADATGIVHVVNQGQTTWHGFAEELFRQQGADVIVEPISTAQYPTPAKRPPFSVLSTDRYKGIVGHELPPWQAGLSRYLSGSRY